MFLEWTPDNRLRHSRFAGIRSDRDARQRSLHATILGMLDDMWSSDPTTHIFCEVLDQKRLTDPRAVGVYRQRLDASNLKLRFAVQALREVTAVVGELEHGEFIYFDDANRLKG
jgi:hypothetical protein